MPKKDEKKSRKRLTLSLGLVIFLGILSIVYAITSSQLNISSTNSQVVRKYDSAVQFVKDGSFAYSVGTTDDSLSSEVSNMGHFYSRESGVTSSNVCDLTDENSSSYIFAKAGTVAISKSNNENDTATIDGTELFDKGSFVVYKLQIKNTSDLPMRLAEYNANSLINSISSDTEGLKEIVDVRIYTNDPSSGGTGTELEDIDANNAKNVTTNTSNCLQPNGTTDWFVRVYCKKEILNFVTGIFKFNVKPIWMPIQR